MHGFRAAIGLVRALKPDRIGMAHWFGLVVLTIVAVLAAATWVEWPSIREALMDPATPYQTYAPPKAPDYAQRAAWALPPADVAAAKLDAAPADIFFVGPTTYQNRQWNAPIGNRPAAQRLARFMLPNYAGPFAQIGRVFAPRYRQASLYTQLTLREDARDARAFAYDDVKRAFDYYLAHYDTGRPLVIVGVEQGGLIAGRLASDALSEHPDMRARLAAVYLIETPEPAAIHGPGSPLPACTQRDQAHCVVAYLANVRAEDGLLHDKLRHQAPQWQGDLLVPLAGAPVLCVNPLLGAVSQANAPTTLNLGAANASGLEWGEPAPVQSHQVSAKCDDKGVLQVSTPRSGSLRGRANWADSVSVRPYNWFYADLAADAKARVAALAAGK